MNDIKKEFNTKFGEPMSDYPGHRTTHWMPLPEPPLSEFKGEK